MPNPRSISALKRLSDAIAQMVAELAPQVVAIRSRHSRSSGFIWRPGLIVTADEALADEGKIEIVLPGGAAGATLVGRDPTTDIALIRMEQNDLQPVRLSTESAVPGALALAVGSHEGAPVAALGVVSISGPRWRSLRGGEIDARIEFDMSLRRHAEGGVALDSSGRAFGMTVFGPRRRVLVIPSATIARVAAKLETHGRIARGYVGLGLQPVRLDGDAGIGAMAMSVDPEGPGAAAGVRQGDVIVAWDGQPVRNVQSLVRALGPDSVGSAVSLSLRRAGEPVEVTLTIGERPAA